MTSDWITSKIATVYPAIYPLGTSLGSLIMSYFLAWHTALSGLQSSNLGQNCGSALELENHIHNFHLRKQFVPYMVGEHVLRLGLRVMLN